MAKSKPLSDLGDTDLIEKLADAKEELFNLRFQLATGQLDNSARMKLVKKEIARVNTELRAREIADADALASSASGEDN
ncbi:MAG: 50S ribosomal protein L29 [Acidimicrobiaceae bacterium]|jgi:large subunit ribosomal protein L29|nr:50S ribosomal protein L29 [Acidimicrobiaceae bacterium]MBT5579121.1 50S ribosomal protein L29 [Acidimicrobiaceae bacterium]MBT5849455.1 50S ribosomal protein L29 [Acidimicrobiaceae bacterium]MDG1412423.1 50S ribosomal protein L29 [Acidimicrobiales bacterium]MDG2216535.1 50S ribosomal protein L29 [Acidimicrobiales bacterium]